MTLDNKEHSRCESLEDIMSQIGTVKSSLQTLVSADARVHSTEDFRFSRNVCQRSQRSTF